MRVGVPREIKVLENRVGLTPASVREFVARGHAVEVEHDAGAGIGLHLRGKITDRTVAKKYPTTGGGHTAAKLHLRSHFLESHFQG